MTTQNARGADNDVRRLEDEVEELRRRKAQATAQLRAAREGLARLDERRNELAPRTFGPDEGAARELADLEDEHDRAARSERVALAALPGLDGQIDDAVEKLVEARRAVHREEADELYRRSRDLDGKRDELAEELRTVLEEQARLDFDRAQAVRLYDGDEANRMAIAGDTTGDYLRSAFARWLS